MNLSSDHSQLYPYRSGLFKITKAPITPGIHPQSVNKQIITKDPQPLPITDNGGKIMASKTLNKLIFFNVLCLLDDVLKRLLQFRK